MISFDCLYLLVFISKKNSTHVFTLKLDCVNAFNLFGVVQRWKEHGCTRQIGRNPISVESLINSLKLRRNMQKMRRHNGYIAHAKHARI